MPILILNVAWMRAYKGLDKDVPVGTFSYMKDGGTPYEIYNFLPQRGRCYGYAPVKNGRINIKKLGAKPGDDAIDDVTVIWTATHPDGGRYIVGWYEGARVHTEQQKRATSRATAILNSPHYSVEAPAVNCHLLPPDERVFALPTMRPGFPGMSASFFPEGNAPSSWVDKVRKYIATGDINAAAPVKGEGGKDVDPEYRKKVEEAAIRRVTAHYKQLRFKVCSREADNLGWDLEARRGALLLRLEVKGLSGREAIAELTPNEYLAMRSDSHRPSYRICIVTNALEGKSSALRIFSHDNRLSAWVSDELETLVIQERVAARLSIGEPK